MVLIIYILKTIMKIFQNQNINNFIKQTKRANKSEINI